MEQRVCTKTGCAERRRSPGASEVLMKTTEPSFQIQATRVRSCRRNSRIVDWLSETDTRKVSLQLLMAGLFLLFIWLLAELHIILPCFLLCCCLFNEELQRAASSAWTWLTAPVRAQGVEKMAHADGAAEIMGEDSW